MRTTNDKKEYLLAGRLGQDDEAYVKSMMKKRGMTATEYIKYLVSLDKKQYQ